MNREKMLQNPLPIDRTARRVVRSAKPEDLWRPMPKAVNALCPPGSVLATTSIPLAAIKSNSDLKSVVGHRRGRMVVIGYAANQEHAKESAYWVARCDCGNHEYRKRILRWIGTDAPDMCRECRTRMFHIHGEFMPRVPARRQTLEEHERKKCATLPE